MKNLSLLSIVCSIMLMSCVTESVLPGPPGPPGPPGSDGGIFVGESFDVAVDFLYYPDTGLQEVIVPLPYDILESDAVLVYRLEKEVVIDGIVTDAWSPLPQNFFLDGGDIIQYIFNHSFADVELLIDGNFDLEFLSPDFTVAQVFKIVIVPADAIFGIDTSNLEAVMALGNFKSQQIEL